MVRRVTACFYDRPRREMIDGNEHIDRNDDGNIDTSADVDVTVAVSPAEHVAQALDPELPVVNPKPSGSRRGLAPSNFGPRGGAPRELRDTVRRGHLLFGGDPSDQTLALDEGGAENTAVASFEAEDTNVHAGSGPQPPADETLISTNSERDMGPTDGVHAQAETVGVRIHGYAACAGT